MDKDMQPTMTTDDEGTKRWKLNGKFHRTDGPALIHANGNKSWALHGNRHRTDGPAVDNSDGHKEWYIHGHEYTFEKWLNDNPELNDEEKVMMKLKYG
jgi:hypothetical protein